MNGSLCDQLAPLAEASFLSVGIETGDDHEASTVEAPETATKRKSPAKAKATSKAKAETKPKTEAKPAKQKVSTKIKKVPATDPVIAKAPAEKSQPAQAEVPTPAAVKAEPEVITSSTWKRVAVTIPMSFRTRSGGAQKSLDLFFPMGSGHSLRMSVTGLVDDFEPKRGDVLVGTLALNDSHDGRHRYMSATLVLEQSHVLAQRQLIVHEKGERTPRWVFVHNLRTGGLFEIALPDGDQSV